MPMGRSSSAIRTGADVGATVGEGATVGTGVGDGSSVATGLLDGVPAGAAQAMTKSAMAPIRTTEKSCIMWWTLAHRWGNVHHSDRTIHISWPQTLGCA